MHECGFGKVTFAFCVFGSEKVPPSGSGSEHLTCASDFEALGHGLTRFISGNWLWHKDIEYILQLGKIKCKNHLSAGDKHP